MSLDQVIVALDFPTAVGARELLKKIHSEVSYVKIGLELFYSEGPSLLDEIKSLDLKIFLDLKLHDIPATVTKAASVLAKHKVDMVNVHAAGGSEMMRNACEAYKSIHPAGHMIAVTQLTSTSQEVLNNEIQIAGDIQANVIHYAGLAKNSGLDGVVCSAWETEALKKELGTDFLCVTPGIRLNKSQSQDQKRVKAPGEALKGGADFLVMGREITQAPDPLAVIANIKKDIA